MRILILAGGVLLGVAIQATLFAKLNLPGQLTPDLILIMAIAYGLLRGPDEGMIFGAVVGFMLDLLSGGLIGISVLSKMTAGFAAGLLEKTIFKDNLLVPALAAFVGTILISSFEIILQLAFKSNYHFGFTLLSAILPLALYNAIFAPFIYYLFLKLEHILVERDSNA